MVNRNPIPQRRCDAVIMLGPVCEVFSGIVLLSNAKWRKGEWTLRFRIRMGKSQR